MNSKNSLKTLKSVLLLVEQHKLDEIEFNGIKIKKSKHATEPQKTQQVNPAHEKEPVKPAALPTSIAEIDRMNRTMMGLEN